jgi:hypothetical protein
MIIPMYSVPPLSVLGRMPRSNYDILKSTISDTPKPAPIARRAQGERCPVRGVFLLKVNNCR